MTSFGNTYLRVEGNTDSTGSAAANLTLSDRRAIAVKNYILKNFPNIEPARFQPIGRGFHKVRARYGFMERPDVPALIDQAMKDVGLAQPRTSVVYFMGRETHLVTNKGRLAGLLEHVFAFMARNALPASLYFQIPPEQVIEMGMQLDL